MFKEDDLIAEIERLRTERWKLNRQVKGAQRIVRELKTMYPNEFGEPGRTLANLGRALGMPEEGT